MKKIKLTKRELDVMEILWHTHHQMSANEIQEKSDNVSIYTIQQVLQRLLEKGYIKVSGYGKSTKTIMRYYEKILNESEYVQSFVENNTLFDLTANFISNTSDIVELEKLKKIINEKEKELLKK